MTVCGATDFDVPSDAITAFCTDMVIALICVRYGMIVWGHTL